MCELPSVKRMVACFIGGFTGSIAHLKGLHGSLRLVVPHNRLAAVQTGENPWLGRVEFHGFDTLRANAQQFLYLHECFCHAIINVLLYQDGVPIERSKNTVNTLFKLTMVIVEQEKL